MISADESAPSRTRTAGPPVLPGDVTSAVRASVAIPAASSARAIRQASRNISPNSLKVAHAGHYLDLSEPRCPRPILWAAPHVHQVSFDRLLNLNICCRRVPWDA